MMAILMNYLDAERARYQNQDRYATSPEASGQETRAFLNFPE